MSMTCRTCAHPQREAIDKALALGEAILAELSSGAVELNGEVSDGAVRTGE